MAFTGSALSVVVTVATKKPKTAEANSFHEIEIEVYKSSMMNTDLHQPLCSCGWEDARWFTEAQAKAAAAKHLAKTKP